MLLHLIELPQDLLHLKEVTFNQLHYHYPHFEKPIIYKIIYT
jgi:hypothetical protein